MPAGLFVLSAAHAATFNVNSPADVLDATPGDGVCETAAGNHVCTLRAAVQEANALTGADVINLQANTTYLLTRVGTPFSLSGSLDISDSVDIVGAGPASSIIDGNGEVTQDRVFFVNSCRQFNCEVGTVVVKMTGISIRHGHSSNGGGGLFLDYQLGYSPEVTLTDCSVEANTSDSLGGGILSFGSLILTRSLVAANTGSAGGGISVLGPTIVEDSTIRDNHASQGGGGIDFVGKGLISRSTITGNHASEGGGIFAATGETEPDELYVVNSTIAGNSSDAGGGGLESYIGTTNLFNVTIAGNTANADRTGGGAGGGVLTSVNATLNFTNSIMANNSRLVSDSLFSVLEDCSGTITSQGYVIVTHPTCTVAGAYTTNAVQFGPLQYNGGVTQTLALLAGSGGIDVGNPAGCTDELGAILDVDQRGLPRPVGSACDLGAYEVQPDTIFKDDFDV